jgi:hypothetical protein
MISLGVSAAVMCLVLVWFMCTLRDSFIKNIVANITPQLSILDSKYRYAKLKWTTFTMQLTNDSNKKRSERLIKLKIDCQSLSEEEAEKLRVAIQESERKSSLSKGGKNKASNANKAQRGGSGGAEQYQILDDSNI